MTVVSFTRAKAGAGDFLCVACLPDSMEPFTKFTRLCRWDGAAAGPVKWFYDDVPFAVTAMVRFTPQAGESESFVALSAEGDVMLMREPFIRNASRSSGRSGTGRGSRGL